MSEFLTQIKFFNMLIDKIYKIFNVINENKTFISVITAFIMVPLFTSGKTSPLRSSMSQVTLFLIFGIFTLSFELQLARTGLLNFGQAVFFGVGAYGLAFYLDFITTFTVNTVIDIGPVILPPPVLISFLQDPLTILIIAVIVGILFGSLLGFVMGLTTNRMRGTSFAFIALAIAMVFYSYLSNNPEGSALSGGETGKLVPPPNILISQSFYVFFAIIITSIIFLIFILLVFQDLKQRRGFFGISLFKSPLQNFSLEKDELKNIRVIIKSAIFIAFLVALFSLIFLIFIPNILNILDLGASNFLLFIPINYYFVLTISVLVYLLLKRVIQSPFGRVLASISQNEERAQALGYNVYRYKIKSLTLSGAIAGLSGALYGATAKILSPDTTFTVSNTINVMIYSIVGGLNTLFGPFLGAAFVMSSSSPTGLLIGLLGRVDLTMDMGILVIGIIYILIVMFLPFGIAGTFQFRMNKISEILRKIRITPNDYYIFGFLSVFLAFLFLINTPQLVNMIPFIDLPEILFLIVDPVLNLLLLLFPLIFIVVLIFIVYYLIIHFRKK